MCSVADLVDAVFRFRPASAIDVHVNDLPKFTRQEIWKWDSMWVSRVEIHLRFQALLVGAQSWAVRAARLLDDSIIDLDLLGSFKSPEVYALRAFLLPHYTPL